MDNKDKKVVDVAKEEPKKKAEKKIFATLTKKETYTENDVMYIKDTPAEVDADTARELKITGYFKFGVEE